MSEQIICGGTYNALHSTSTEYEYLMGGFPASWSVSESRFSAPAPCAGTLSDFYVELNDSPGSGTSYTFNMRNEHATPASTLAVAISDLNTENSDTSNTVDVDAGDRINIQVIPANTPTSREAYWSVKWTPDTDKQTILLGGTRNHPTNGHYYGPAGPGYGDATEIRAAMVCSIDATIKAFYVVTESPMGGGDSVTFSVRIDGANPTPQPTITISAGSSGNDTTNQPTISAGSYITISYTEGGTPTPGYCRWGLMLEADTDGQFVVPLTSENIMNNGATEYIQVCSGGGIWSSTEGQAYTGGQAMTIQAVYSLLDGSPGSGNSWTHTLRQNAGDSALAVTISDLNTSNNQATDVTISNFDLLTTKATQSGGATNRRAQISYKGYIAPVGGLTRQPLILGGGVLRPWEV